MSQEPVSRRGLLGTSLKSAAELVGPSLPGLKQLSGSKRLPVIYCTEGTDALADALVLACLYAQPDLDLRGVVLDTTNNAAGFRTVHQLNYLTGRSVLALAGLPTKLRTEGDPALDQPVETQQGVNFLLSELATQKERVLLVIAGSARDLMAAYSRNPRLVQARCRAVYAHLSETRARLSELLSAAPEPFVKLCHGLWRKETDDPLAALLTPLPLEERAALLHTERTLLGGGPLPQGPTLAELMARLPRTRTL